MSSDFVVHDLGQVKAGLIIEVTLDKAANVRLLDASNFSAYRNGKNHRYQGGHVTRSPYRLAVPRTTHWRVVIDFGGLPGRIRSSARVLPGPLPAAKSIDPRLEAIARSVAEQDEGVATGKDYDVFISHAAEDKDAIARALASELRARDLRVWFDEFELTLGKSLRRSIDAGLTRCRFGVIILSPWFFKKNWPQYELDGLVSREMDGEQVILPLWHQISKDEVMRQSPSLADKVALSTSQYTVEEIANEIAAIAYPNQTP